MTNLLKTPYSHPEDLGKPIPGWPHATSVCMPKWSDNVDYEKGESRITEDLTCGYPRFIFHPFVKELSSRCAEKFALPGEICLALPSKKVAEKCRDYIASNSESNPKVHSLGINTIYAVSIPEKYADIAKDFWQHTGEIVSTRHAKAALDNNKGKSNSQSEQKLKRRIAEFAGANVDDIYLYPSGMSAIFNIYSGFQNLLPNRKSIQFGFPYVDTLKIQKKFGCGVDFYCKGDNNDLKKLQESLKNESVMGIFCEFPMNPLLSSPDLSRLSQLAKQHKIPLIVDDTIGTFENVRLFPQADVIVTSLTKFFSGVGDVMGGCAILNSRSDLYRDIKTFLDSNYENNLWFEDVDILEQNSQDFSERMQTINATTESLCDVLSQHPNVDQLYYPKYQTPTNYLKYKRKNGGYSGIFSLLLKNPEINSEIVFDKLNISKGPSLGTSFSLACPYTILAHYDDLDFADECGVSRYLIRVSVGLEDANDLISRFNSALSDL